MKTETDKSSVPTPPGLTAENKKYIASIITGEKKDLNAFEKQIVPSLLDHIKAFDTASENLKQLNALVAKEQKKRLSLDGSINALIAVLEHEASKVSEV